jgi:hypothetical protein
LDFYFSRYGPLIGTRWWLNQKRLFVLLSG